MQPRPFQTLHVDFGLPITAREPVDIARFTALHVAAGQPETTAFTRIVPLAPLLAQRAWSDRSTLVGRLRRYATSGRGDHVEGILARLVEAADDCADLPSTAAPGFLCGMEFESIDEERAHFSKRRLDLARAEHRIRLAPGELLVFDNLATAHGRVGARRPNELHQLCVGYPGLQPGHQRTLLLRVLDAFG